MAKARLFDLPQTKGKFQLKGIVTGVKKDDFYKEGTTTTGKDSRKLNFGMEVENGKKLYVRLNAYPREFVFFSKRGKKGEKTVTKRIPWDQRFTYKEEGFNLIGTNFGLKKIVNEEGKTVNDKKTLVEFDATKAISELLMDKQSIFTKGDIEYSSFRGDKGDLRRDVKLVPNQLSLCQEVNLDDPNLDVVRDFTQVLVYLDIDEEVVNEKETGRFILSAKIINYSSIEDAEFIVSDSKLAQMFRKNLKPYTAIEVWGKLDSATSEEEVEEDGWGEANSMNRVNRPVKRELVITGADPSTIDDSLYSEELIEAAMALINKSKNAESDYNGGTSNETSNDWGSASNLASDDEEEAWG